MDIIDGRQRMMPQHIKKSIDEHVDKNLRSEDLRAVWSSDIIQAVLREVTGCPLKNGDESFEKKHWDMRIAGGYENINEDGYPYLEINQE